MESFLCPEAATTTTKNPLCKSPTLYFCLTTEEEEEEGWQ